MSLNNYLSKENKGVNIGDIFGFNLSKFTYSLLDLIESSTIVKYCL